MLWDTEQVFYGSVLGLERRAVVLAVNESTSRLVDWERFYTGLSLATDELVVCEDPARIAALGGPLARSAGPSSAAG